MSRPPDNPPAAAPAVHPGRAADPALPPTGPDPVAGATSPSAAPPGTGRLAVTFLVITMVIDAMGIGLIIPVMPDLILSFLPGASLAQAALWGGTLATLFAAMQFLFGPLLGSLSDRFGRRPVLLGSLIFMAADYVLMAAAGTIWLLFAARAVGGITAATQSTATAYMADISAPGQKAARFGLIWAGFGLGFVLGPVLGGLLGTLGPRAPFWAAAALAALNAGFGALVLRESLPPARRRALSLARANPLGALRHFGRVAGLAPMLAGLFLFQLSTGVYPAIWPYFTQARFGWDTGLVGLSLGLYGMGLALVQGVLIRPLTARLGPRATVAWGLAATAAAMLALGLVTSGTLALVLTPLAALGAVTTPALQSVMSDIAREDEQGALQGLLSSVAALSMILSPMIMTAIFFAATRPGTGRDWPSAPFGLALLLCAAAALVLRGAMRPGAAAPGGAPGTPG